MVEFLQLVLLLLAIGMSLALGAKFKQSVQLVALVRRFASRQGPVVTTIGLSSFLGCLGTACYLHEPVPRVPDEFSYLLLGDTFAFGRVSNPAPSLPEFFETLDVLIRPVYVSKYFPAQGVFLGLGQKLTGHFAVGVWLSSALACAAVCWMLQAWVGPTWALCGGFLMMVQLGIYSYWSQTYWGGMVAALGGALFFGATRRLWTHFKWQNAIWLGVGLVILATSRPLEGALACMPTSVAFLVRIFRQQQWKTMALWRNLVLPAGIVLFLGGAAMAAYDYKTTGVMWKPPYVLHEAQYQETPPFIFMPMRATLTYGNPWLAYNYHVREMRLYTLQRTPARFTRLMTRKLATWWIFYCGVLLTAPLVLPGLLLRGRLRLVQVAMLAGLVFMSLLYDPASLSECAVIDVLGLAQIVLLWVVFDDFWERLAIATLGLLLLDTLFVKVPFPHYSSPIVCLMLFLQVQGLRRMWHWCPQLPPTSAAVSRAERRRAERSQRGGEILFPLRGLAILLPIICAISLVVRIEARIVGWSEDPHGPDRNALLLNDWSVRRAELGEWLKKQTEPQLVFVHYSARHIVGFEWVYNGSDLRDSHVIWAHDLGAEHNRLLIKQLQGRKIWLVNADDTMPQLVPYSEIAATGEPTIGPKNNREQDSPELKDGVGMGGEDRFK
ncbi:MAG TPA: hypothetical protein VN982_03955 [Candidatus Dormibacteraeota bacterium]|nr:hypothetical protein [Candidatus Dormibacteraeota bacterium]